MDLENLHKMIKAQRKRVKRASKTLGELVQLKNELQRLQYREGSLDRSLQSAQEALNIYRPHYEHAQIAAAQEVAAIKDSERAEKREKRMASKPTRFAGFRDNHGRIWRSTEKINEFEYDGFIRTIGWIKTNYSVTPYYEVNN